MGRGHRGHAWLVRATSPKFTNHAGKYSCGLVACLGVTPLVANIGFWQQTAKHHASSAARCRVHGAKLSKCQLAMDVAGKIGEATSLVAADGY